MEQIYQYLSYNYLILPELYTNIALLRALPSFLQSSPLTPFAFLVNANENVEYYALRYALDVIKKGSL